jgi:Enoyl-(Acyl carrier protein) reductase
VGLVNALRETGVPAEWFVASGHGRCDGVAARRLPDAWGDLSSTRRRGRGSGSAPRSPLGRNGEHSELAELAAFMVSDAATFMTGEMVVLDGGAHLRTSGAEDLIGWSQAQWEASSTEPSVLLSAPFSELQNVCLHGLDSEFPIQGFPPPLGHLRPATAARSPALPTSPDRVRPAWPGRRLRREHRHAWKPPAHRAD